MKVTHGTPATGYGHGGKGGGVIPPRGDNNQQKELHAVRVGEQATIHLTNVLGYQIQMIVPSLSGRHMCFLLLMMANP